MATAGATSAILVLYKLLSGPTPTPTPMPTPTPTAAAQPTPLATPNSIAFFLGSPEPTPAPLAVSEAGYAGSFTSAISCTPSPANQSPVAERFVAEISPTTATPATSGAQVTFTVTPGLESGTCTVTVGDTVGATVSVPVSVTSTSIGVQAQQRR
ncbi:MAG TPA: hypothetical protein VMD91_18570 [Candidatus Sulfotelmatobacter sp.]|nr:hypothetical protein [Candidatus Sulfotelmatobacter sp.]